MFSFIVSELFVIKISSAQERAAPDGPQPSPSASRQGNPPASLQKLRLPHHTQSAEAEVISGPNHGWCMVGHRAQPARSCCRTYLSSNWNMKVEVLIKTLDGTHMLSIKFIIHFPTMEFRYFPSFKILCLKYTVRDRFSCSLSKLWSKKNHLK